MRRDFESHIPFVEAGSYPVRGGNLVRPLIDGTPAFRRIGEAVEQARHSVWLTVTFYAHDLAMPDGRGSLFDVLDRAVARGLDVRTIFWRPNPESSGYGRTFRGSEIDREWLRSRGSRFRIRWDRARGAYCQHQKMWLMDAGKPGETAFVGGINLTAQALGSPGHGDGRHHDAYLELAGPSASDVHHNFVQRWNEASERFNEDGVWGHIGDDELPFPTETSAPQGQSLVQIQRTIDAGRYRDGAPSPGARAYDIAAGEQTIFEQYRRAIDAARSSLYFENQAIPIPLIASAIKRALQRGVEVVLLVPAEPEEHVRAARRNLERKTLFDAMAALGRYRNFTLAGIAARNSAGHRDNVYVHGKLMLADDSWATIGSCNLHAFSLQGHSELNASVWDPRIVRALRCDLLAEHLDADCSVMNDREALLLFRKIAHENRRKRDADNPDWQGLAFALDPAAYGE
jgi:phosphatidylserine/phosphatidylglycerophosphate/cardiolipin synthase-like enzyme